MTPSSESPTKSRTISNQISDTRSEPEILALGQAALEDPPPKSLATDRSINDQISDLVLELELVVKEDAIDPTAASPAARLLALSKQALKDPASDRVEFFSEGLGMLRDSLRTAREKSNIIRYGDWCRKLLEVINLADPDAFNAWSENRQKVLASRGLTGKDAKTECESSRGWKAIPPFNGDNNANAELLDLISKEMASVHAWRERVENRAQAPQTPRLDRAAAKCKVANVKFSTYLGILGLYAHRNEVAHDSQAPRPIKFVKPDTDGSPTIDWKGMLEMCLHELKHSTPSQVSSGLAQPMPQDDEVTGFDIIKCYIDAVFSEYTLDPETGTVANVVLSKLGRRLEAKTFRGLKKGSEKDSQMVAVPPHTDYMPGKWDETVPRKKD